MVMRFAAVLFSVTFGKCNDLIWYIKLGLYFNILVYNVGLTQNKSCFILAVRVIWYPVSFYIS